MTTTYLTGKRMPLKATFVVSILRSPDMSKVIRRAPISPRGGDVYVYCIENNLHREAWKNDNIHFHHDGTRGQPKTNPIVRKIFFCAMVGDGRWTRDFMKHVYTLYHNPNNFVVIHYLGDESIARDVPRHRKPRSNTKKHTTCSSTAIQVDTSELSPLSCSSDQQDEEHMMGEDGGHEDYDDDYAELVELGEPTVEIGDTGDDDSGIVQSQMSLSYQSVPNLSEASTSTGTPFTSTPNAGGSFSDPIPLSCLDMMPLTNPLGFLSEVTLSCRALEPSSSHMNAPEASTSFCAFSSFGSSAAANVSVSTPSRESEPSSVIPKKRLAMRLENQEVDPSNIELMTLNPSSSYNQPAGLLPKKRRLEFTESSPIPGPSSVGEHFQSPADEDPSDPDTGQSNRTNGQSPDDGVPEIHPNSTVVVSALSPPSSRTSTPRLRHLVRQGFENSLYCLAQNVQNLQTMLGDPGMWEPDRQVRDAATDTDFSTPSLDAFIQNLVSSGQIAMVVTKVMQLVSSWKQRPGAFNSRFNACMTLICQTRQAWSEDMEMARTRLMEVLGRNPVPECDVKNYYHLMTACVVGAYRTQVPLDMFLTTLCPWPTHLEECDTRSEVEVEENIQCVVGRTLLNGIQLKTLEKMDHVDAQVIRAYLQLVVRHWTACLPQHCYLLPLGLQRLWEMREYTKGMMDKVTLTDFTWILMPYQASDTHWVLLVANVQKKMISVINTAKNDYPDISVEVTDHWRKYMKYRSSHTGQNLTRWTMEEMPVFEQTDETSSGIQIMMAAEAILCGTSPVVMRTCHVRRYRQYALSKLLSAANFDLDAGEIDELVEDDIDLQPEVNLSGDEYDGSPQSASVDTESFSRSSCVSSATHSTSVGTACSSVTVSPASDTTSCLGKHPSSLNSGDQEKAIDFSCCQSAVPSEPKNTEDYRVRDHSSSQFFATPPKEHNYANRGSSTQTSPYEISTAGVTPAHEDPKCSLSKNTSTGSSFQVTGFLFQSGLVPSHQPPSYPGHSVYTGSGRFSDAAASAVQEKPCDMSMQSQLALDSQPSTSTQFSYLQEMESGVEDLRVNTTRNYAASPEPATYHVSESAGATYTELSNVRPSDLQPSSLITSSLSIVANENVDLKTFHKRGPSPSSGSDRSSEMINVESVAPHLRTLITEQSEFVSNPVPLISSEPQPSTSSMSVTVRPSTSDTNRVNQFSAGGHSPSTLCATIRTSTSGASRLMDKDQASESGQKTEDCGGCDSGNGVSLESGRRSDLSNLDMLSTVASKDSS